MDLPDIIPDEDRIEQDREQIRRGYERLGMEATFDQDLIDAQDVAADAGAFPDTQVGDWVVNQMLMQRLQDLGQEMANVARDVSQSGNGN